MTIAAWIVLLIIATLYFDRFLERQHNPNQAVVSVTQDGSTAITLQRNRLGHYVANGRINGTQVRFLLDTGATDVSVPGHIARKLRLERGARVQVATANGTIPVYLTLLHRVQIGDILLHDVRATINPHMQQDEVLLGMSFLKHLEFTQRGDQLVLRQYR